MEQTLLKQKASKPLTVNPVKDFERKLALANSERETQDPTTLALRKKLTIIIGRKCEPYLGDIEPDVLGIFSDPTNVVLRLCKEYEQPVVVETKGLINEKDSENLRRCEAGVSYSITPGNDDKGRLLKEPYPRSILWKMAEDLLKTDIWVGIKGEPIISGVNDSLQEVEEFLDHAKAIKVKSMNFGDYRIHNPRIAYRRMKEAGLDLPNIIRAKKEGWEKFGLVFFEESRKRNIMVTTPDWVNFGLMNDFESCCGFDLRFSLHHFTFQHALKEVARNGKITFSEVLKHNIFGESLVQKFRDIWNGKAGYYTLADFKGIGVLGRDGNGDRIYGKTKTLKEAFL